MKDGLLKSEAIFTFTLLHQRPIFHGVYLPSVLTIFFPTVLVNIKWLKSSGFRGGNWLFFVECCSVSR